MPTVDTTTIDNGYGQQITDWVLGDDRDFSGSGAASVNPPPATDPIFASVYFTLKNNQLQPDANSIIQVEITLSASPGGQITVPNTIALYVSGANYQGLVQAGATYWWDFRAITTGGRTLTLASGTVQFQQNTTDTDSAGTPAAFPNNGLPRFRGFTNASPQTNFSNTAMIFNVGDFYMNSQPTANGPAGWQCVGQGSPGTWIQFFFSGGGTPGVNEIIAGTNITVSSNTGNVTVSASGGFTPGVNWTFGTAAPSTGLHALGDVVWNTAPSPGNTFGWICTAGGTPGTWKEMGLISL